MRLELVLAQPHTVHCPDDELKFQYRLFPISTAGPDKVMTSVEVSVLWRTEGKGDEDFGVHFFDRRTAETHDNLLGPAHFAVRLPASPLSYDGRILKIRWCVRVRAYVGKSKLTGNGFPLTAEEPFRLVRRVVV